jgi:phosphoglycolate phosphatase
MYTTVVFDLDGTLLDTLDDLAAAVNHALTAFGLPVRTKEEVRGFIGNGIAKLMQRAVGYEHSRFDEILAEFKRHYGAHCADKTQPYEGVLPLLQRLKEKGVRTAVLSNKADFAVKALADTYFKGLLLEAVGENESLGIRKKPAPDALFAVMERLGVSNNQTLYIGDSEVDIQTAKNAGVACACVTWGFREKAFLEKNGAEIFIDEPNELLGYTL